MRIIAAYYTHKPGGLCKRLYRLLNSLAESEHAVYYCALDHPGGAISDKVVFQRIPFPIYSRSGPLFWGLFICWLPLYLCYAALRIRPDRYLAFGAFYAAMFLPARFLVQGELILFLRSLVFEINRLTGKNPVVRLVSDLVDRIGIQSATKVICMSQSMCSAISKRFDASPRKMQVLPNDLPLPAANCAPAATQPGVLRILTSGVIDRRKNLEVVLDSLALLPAEQRKRLRLDVAGEGPELQKLRAKAAELGCVELHGWVPDIADRVGSYDLVLHPSLHEGVSNSVLEALAANRAVLLSRIPEHVEFFPESLLFSAKDPRELATLLGTVLGDPATLPRLQAAAVEASTRFKFNWEDAARDLITEPFQLDEST